MWIGVRVTEIELDHRTMYSGFSAEHPKCEVYMEQTTWSVATRARVENSGARAHELGL